MPRIPRRALNSRVISSGSSFQVTLRLSEDMPSDSVADVISAGILIPTASSALAPASGYTVACDVSPVSASGLAPSSEESPEATAAAQIVRLIRHRTLVGSLMFILTLIDVANPVEWPLREA